MHYKSSKFKFSPCSKCRIRSPMINSFRSHSKPSGKLFANLWIFYIAHSWLVKFGHLAASGKLDTGECNICLISFFQYRVVNFSHEIFHKIYGCAYEQFSHAIRSVDNEKKFKRARRRSMHIMNLTVTLILKNIKYSLSNYIINYIWKNYKKRIWIEESLTC